MTAHEWGPTKGMLPQQRTALRNLMDAPGWKERPCKDARAWDIPSAKGSTLQREIDRRTETCQHECTLYQLCDAYAATNPAANGVLAGRVIEGQDITA